MTSLRCLAIAILVAAGYLQTQVSKDWAKALGGITATNPPPRSSPTSNAVNMNRLGVPMATSASLPVLMRARDLTYQVQLPAGWRPMVQPMLEYGLVFGTQGESFAMGMEDVYLDARMLNSILNPGYRAILPPAQFILKSRMVAPPMGPR